MHKAGLNTNFPISAFAINCTLTDYNFFSVKFKFKRNLFWRGFRLNAVCRKLTGHA